MFDTLRTILAFIIDIGVLIFIHELGHYLAARSQGVAVEVFSIGFGPALLRWGGRQGGTRWQVCALPLGGYVKMQGWGESEACAPPLPGSFAGASLGSKAVIVAAGPLANLLLAFVLYAGLFMSVGQVVTQPVLSKIEPASPAALAHLQAGDRVLAIGSDKINNFRELQQVVAMNPDRLMDFTIRRGTAQLTVPVQLGQAKFDGAKVGHLGVVGAVSTWRHYGPVAAIREAGRECWSEIAGWIAGLKMLFVQHRGWHDLTGPLGIAEISGQAAAMGVASMIGLIALLSINLGLVNLIPIPILDGGHLLFYAVEAVLRRPISVRVREFALMLGGMLIASLFFVITFNDLARMGAFSWFTHLLQG